MIHLFEIETMKGVDCESLVSATGRTGEPLLLNAACQTAFPYVGSTQTGTTQ